MSSVRRSLVLSFAERYTGLVVMFASTLVLARLLTPSEIGIYSIAAVVVFLAHSVRDFGLGEYVVQERELTPERLRSAFGVAIALGWLLAGLVAIVARPLAAFYGEPGVGEVLTILALNLVLLPFTTVPIAMWRRDMRFGPPYVMKTAGAVAHAVTAVSLAFTGFGYLSLAWAPVAGTAVTVFVNNVFFRHPAMPWRPGFGEIGRVVNFTGFATAASVIRELSRSAPELVIGKILGMTEVGLFSRAMSSIRLFQFGVSAAVRGVSVPMFAQVAREGRDVAPVYVKAFDMFAGVAWPFFAVLAVLAYPLVRILYGPQWDAAVPILKILCMFGALAAPFQLSNQALMGTGGVRKSTVMEATLLLLAFLGTMASAGMGLHWVAVALCSAMGVSLAVALRAVHGHFRPSVSALLGAAGRNGALALFSALLPIAVVVTSPPGPSNVWLPGLLGGAGAAVGWLVGLIVVNHPLRTELSLVWGRLEAAVRKEA